MHASEQLDLSQIAAVASRRERPGYAQLMMDLHGITVGESTCDGCGAVVPADKPTDRLVLEGCRECGRRYSTRCLGWSRHDEET